MMNRRLFMASLGTLGVSLPALFTPGREIWAQVSNEQLALTARQYLSRYGNCAQASFATLHEHFDLEEGKIFKALSPFPGIGLRGETCGAVVGSIMALGLIFGRDKTDDYGKFIASAAIAREFCDQFQKEYGSTRCGDILESKLGNRFNLADPAEASTFRAVVGDLCGRVVTSGVQIAADLMKKHGARI
jgi:C_GCAxxG_C_C family probable redox protein